MDTQPAAGIAPVLVCLGTRPEVIKLAPVIQELERRGEAVLIVTTGQHREMLEQTLAAFDIRPNIDLELMQPNQSLAELSGRAIPAVDRVISSARPRAVLVQGDTTTAMAGALCAFYQQVPVGHVEAGLRTGVRYNPFPEEVNRRLVAQIATWHFCPTASSRINLLREGIDGESVYVTGNTVVDAALHTAERIDSRPAIKNDRRRILVTLHRRESQGEAQRMISKAIAALADRPDVQVLFPMHLSPAVRASVMPELSNHPNVELCDPIGYEQLIAELCRADLVLTDSGGLQEEAPAFDVPVLVLRETTERPEGVAAGCSVLCGTDPDRILRTANDLLDDETEYLRMAVAPNPYGDGRAAERIVDVLAATRDDAPDRLMMA